ncbi:MAG: sugar transferase [Pseudomonadota bacterium]
MDLVIAGVGIVVLSPLMALIALGIAATSSGPVLFRQLRVGLNGKDFRFFKFRTMTCLPGAEEGLFTPGERCRVTPLGRYLRASKLDELPQLFNVLKGDMSLVGPRPEVRQWVEAYPERWAFVHTCKPGIFDPAVIQFRNEEDLLARAEDPDQMYRDVILPIKLGLNEAYAARRGLVQDLRILIRGVLSVFLGPAALKAEQRVPGELRNSSSNRFRSETS